MLSLALRVYSHFLNYMHIDNVQTLVGTRAINIYLHIDLTHRHRVESKFISVAYAIPSSLMSYGFLKTISFKSSCRVICG